MCLVRGQYSDAVLSELESQNDNELEGMSAKVKMLKDVRRPACHSLLSFKMSSSLALRTQLTFWLSVCR